MPSRPRWRESDRDGPAPLAGPVRPRGARGEPLLRRAPGCRVRALLRGLRSTARPRLLLLPAHQLRAGDPHRSPPRRAGGRELVTAAPLARPLHSPGCRPRPRWVPASLGRPDACHAYTCDYLYHCLEGILPPAVILQLQEGLEVFTAIREARRTDQAAFAACQAQVEQLEPPWSKLAGSYRNRARLCCPQGGGDRRMRPRHDALIAPDLPRPPKSDGSGI